MVEYSLSDESAYLFSESYILVYNSYTMQLSTLLFLCLMQLPGGNNEMSLQFFVLDLLLSTIWTTLILNSELFVREHGKREGPAVSSI